MQDSERRRYFRIDDTVGISYTVIEGEELNTNPGIQAPDLLDMVAQQDQQIEKLLIEVEDSHPKVAELITVFNQKLERVVSQLAMESKLLGRLAHRVKEANLSACGVAFSNNEKVAEGSRLKIELTLYPEEKTLSLSGIVVGCEQVGKEWFWRIDFYGLTDTLQEALIQHVVRSQSLQIKKIRGN